MGNSRGGRLPRTNQVPPSQLKGFRWNNVIPNWLRFRTKESAEKFAKALKDSHKLEGIEWGESNSGTFYIQEKGVLDGRAEMEDLIDALNDRVK